MAKSSLFGEEGLYPPPVEGVKRMVKIKFTPSKQHPSYTGSLYFNAENAVQDVTENEAKRLIGDFPHLFSLYVEKETKKKFEAPVNRSMQGKGKNK